MNISGYRLLLQFFCQDLEEDLQTINPERDAERFERYARFIEKLTWLYIAVDKAWQVRPSEPTEKHWRSIKSRIQSIMREYGPNGVYDFDKKLGVVIRGLLFLTFDKLNLPEEERTFSDD